MADQPSWNEKADNKTDESVMCMRQITMGTSNDIIKRHSSAGNAHPPGMAIVRPHHAAGLLSLKHSAAGPAFPSARPSTQDREHSAENWATNKCDEYPEDQPSPVSSEEQAARSFSFPDHSVHSFQSRDQKPNVPILHPQCGQPMLTPVQRFLTKESLGFIPKMSSHQHATMDGLRAFGNENQGTNAPPAIRLPSLNVQNIHAQNSPRCPLPAGKLAPLGQHSSMSEESSPRLPSTLQFPIPALNPAKRQCSSPSGRLPSLPFTPSLSDIGGPLCYQRSVSCPSDAMSQAAMVTGSTDPPVQPFHIISPNLFPKARLERSSSVDATTVLKIRALHRQALHPQEEPLPCDAPRSPHQDFQWNSRGHEPLERLAASADALRTLGASAVVNLQSQSHGQVLSADDDLQPPRSSISADTRREKKLCAFADCTSNAVTRGLCISHGGGRRCQRKGCTRGAQSKGLCVAHGGGRICHHKGCSNIQRSMGLCIRHGGGKRCSVAGCQKGVVRQDLCTAHGGKRKCKVEDCTKHVKKKGLCRSHANSVLGNSWDNSSAQASADGSMSPSFASGGSVPAM